MQDTKDLQQRFLNLFSSIRTNKMSLSPSEYAEKYRKLTSDVSTITGKFKYNITPYLKEVVDTLSPYHPAKIVAVMKGAQIGFTEGVIVNGILWMIANNPGNCLALSANDDLSKEMVESRLDQGIQSCGIQHLIRPNTIRKRNQRTGDTSKYKEYAGGRLFAGGLNSIDKLARQRSIRFGFFDDWDAAPISDKDQGNIFDLIQQRFSTAAKSMKQYYISTPETKPSNIEKVYQMGDQRKWFVPCPKCGAYIEILWNHQKDKETVGVYFEKDSAGKLIEKSVGYVCQECGGFFKETYKYDMNLNGKYIPTADPIRAGFYSYHIPCFISAPHMYSWTDYAHKWLDIWKGGNESKSKRKVFRNQVEGLPWEDKKENVQRNRLIKNTRKYEVGTVPNKQSKEDGNGNIVLLTCACDLNGTLDDARLDYDVFAWSENGSVYSVDQGSVGTYRAKSDPEKRDCWTYRNEKPNNVWDYLYNEIIARSYYTDDGNERKVMLTGIDTGYYTHFAYGFIDQYPGSVVGIKGRADDKFVKISKDVRLYKEARERPNLYIVETDKIKDILSEMINLRWTETEPQPGGFMNFPVPTAEKYTPKYFSQYEQEEKVIEENEDGEPVGWKWKKKFVTAQNHFFDTAVYNIALREIISQRICKEFDIKNGSWTDFVTIIKKIAGI